MWTEDRRFLAIKCPGAATRLLQGPTPQDTERLAQQLQSVTAEHDEHHVVFVLPADKTSTTR
jgi:hypothetical protein